MKEQKCQHCFCRTKTVSSDAYGMRKIRVRYCCWCGDEQPGRGSM